MEEGLKDFTINWVLVGFLIFSMIAFATTFMYENNPSGFGADASQKFADANTAIGAKLLSSESDSNILLNITSNTNPEVSDSGSRDNVAAGYSAKGAGSGYWESIKLFVSWIFSGTVGSMLLAVMGAIVGLTGFFLLAKWIRNTY